MQKAISALSEIVGYQVDIETDLSQLWYDLQKYSPDPETFVPDIAAIVQEWASGLAARLEDDSNAEWTDELLNDVNRHGCVIRLRLEVGLRT